MFWGDAGLAAFSAWSAAVPWEEEGDRSVTCNKTWAASPGVVLANESTHLNTEFGSSLGLAC